MNLKKSLVLGILAISMISCGSSYTTKTKFRTTADSVAYLMGASDGINLKQSFTRMGLDTIIDVKVYFEGMYDSYYNKKQRIIVDSTVGEIIISSSLNKIQMQQQKMRNDTTGNIEPLVFSKSYADTLGYIMGIGDGIGMRNGFEEQGFNSVGITFQFYYEGLRDGTLEDSVRIDIFKYGNMITEFSNAMRMKKLLEMFGDYKLENENFLDKNKANSDVVTTESGLQYTIITEGTGEKPGPMSKVKVHYTGSLIDGTVFDSSVERGEPAVFGVFQVIPGWTEALQLMPVGSKWKLFIPYELAYGENGAGQLIKPFSTLIFEVELLEIVQ